MADSRLPMQNMKMAVVFIIILFSISASSILVLLSGATSISCSFWRVFLASLILWLMWISRGGLERNSLTRETLIYSVFSGIVLAVHFLLWMESLFIIPVSVSTTVVVSYPIFSAIIDNFVFREKISMFQFAGLILGFTGILLFMHPQILAGYNAQGVLLAFGGALGATGYFSLGRLVRRRVGILCYTVLAYTTSSIILLLYALLSNTNLLDYPPRTYICFILLAVVPMIGGHTLINYLLKYVKTSVATSIALGEPIGASLLAYLFLQQQIDTPKALVMALVLSSIALTISQEKEGLFLG